MIDDLSVSSPDFIRLIGADKQWVVRFRLCLLSQLKQKIPDLPFQPNENKVSPHRTTVSRPGNTPSQKGRRLRHDVNPQLRMTEKCLAKGKGDQITT